jgi:mono/diheme cytochrome c family protein
MKKIVHTIGFFGLGALVVVLLALTAPDVLGQEKKKVDGKALFNQKCLTCHKPTKFKELGSDRKGWVLTLSRMQRSTCPMTDDELEVLADYLAKEYGDY